MKKKLIGILVCMLLIATVLPVSGTVLMERTPISTSLGDTFYVGGSGPGNYSTIQEAIDNASDGDTVFVYNGTYFEHIIIDKELILIGEILEETVLDGFFEKELINIYSSFVTIKNFTLQRSKHRPISVGGYYSHFAGIYISNCNFTDCDGGLYFENVSDIYVFNCSFSNLDGTGIYIIPPSNNISINHCFINNCNNSGIDIGGSNISIGYCRISNNTYSGIMIDQRSKNIRVFCNIIRSNGGGIHISEHGSSGESSNITIENNQIEKNGYGGAFDAGILLSDCLRSVIIEGNNIINNDGDGIYLLRTSGIVINQNEISQNQRCGLFLDASSQNLIHHNNFINNKINAFFLNSNYNKWNDNYWNRPRLLPKPIFGALIIFPWVQFDWHPSQEPYDIPTSV
ncbi:MAG: right-handed parallel beta-helix repeat-containing protein [Thermoplasmatales archaeon]|nr:right-handed parallel beta-helix repeat-containing protein [Thermoplasmatales archaeon]